MAGQAMLDFQQFSSFFVLFLVFIFVLMRFLFRNIHPYIPCLGPLVSHPSQSLLYLCVVLTTIMNSIPKTSLTISMNASRETPSSDETYPKSLMRDFSFAGPPGCRLFSPYCFLLSARSSPPLQAASYGALSSFGLENGALAWCSPSTVRIVQSLG